jgi:membrane protease YdiL (CAAX protease family)
MATLTEATAPARTTGVALGLAGLIIVAEYLARRVLAPSLPILGVPVVNDMLAAAICYGALVTLTASASSRSLAALGDALFGVGRQATRWLPWVGAILFLTAVLVLVPLDRWLWGAVQLPSFTAPASTIVLFADAATPLAIVSLLLVNGVVIPLAEERLWRGLIQPRLRLSWGVVPGLLVTAVLFSLKHVIVDASPGRLMALTAGGLVLGVVAFRSVHSEGDRGGWRASAISHMVGNLVATGLALAAGAL